MSTEPAGQTALVPGPGPGSASCAEILQARRLVRRASWWRLALVEAVQLPALGLVVLSAHPAAWWVAGIWGSVACCAGTDSQWRWRNRALVAQAMLWLLAALLFGTGSRSPGALH